jgi:hypothetical protein
MDERKDRLTATDSDPNKRADELEQQAGAIRSDLDGLVGELDHRTHDVMRKYVKPVAIGAAVFVVGLVSFLVWRKYRRRPRSGLDRLGTALKRAVAHPDRVAEASPSIAKKAIAAAAATGVSVAVRRLVSRALPDRKAQPSR